MNPFISICIPAYKNTAHLQRLLDSVATQTFTNYEVVITDDSPDNSVESFINTYSGNKTVRYFRNPVALGTPENWNEAIRRAGGTWIKLVHQDDWLAHEKVLEIFVRAIQKYPGCPFLFSAFRNIDQETGKKKVVRCSYFDLFFLRLNPLHLFKKVYIGNPSCTLIRRDIDLFYDRQFKFVVDFEYYIRCIRKVKKWKYIDEPLLNIGIHYEQVTRYTFLVPSVQIPENHILIEKFGISILRNIFVYDYYWRMYRNLKVRGVEDVIKYYPATMPEPLRQIISSQHKIPLAVLKSGVISKLLMIFSYTLHFPRRQ